MFRKQQEKFTATVTPEKSFIQIEGKLTQAQLEAIAGGGVTLN